MTEGDADIPENRCGFELRPEDIGVSSTQDSWREEISAVCCWRSIWESHDDTGQCIWHADEDEKPIDGLLESRADIPERLDGAILRGVDAEDRLSVSECGFIGARFDDANIQNAEFTSADLRFAEFPNAYLREATFSGADLRFATFPDADLRRGSAFIGADLRFAAFSGAELVGATFSKASLTGAEFLDTDLQWVEFSDTDLQKADLSDADASNATFRHANCQDAVFTRTDCRGATFTSALLYETVFANTRINSRTTFYESITSRPTCVYEDNFDTAKQLPDEVQSLEAARWVYRRFETLHEENALSEVARDFHISKEEAERALYWEDEKYGPWGVKTLMWYLTKHGESVRRVLAWWGVVILTAGALFSFVGGVRDSPGTTHALASFADLATIEGWQKILLNVYFSVTTFSTIMDGDLAPAGPGARGARRG